MRSGTRRSEIRHFHPEPPKKLSDSRNRSDSHDARRHTRRCHAKHTGKRDEAMPRDRRRRSEKHCGRSISHYQGLLKGF
jgi:hypothetical protein